LDKYTRNFEIPIKLFSASARAERKKKEKDMREIDPDFDALDDIYGHNGGIVEADQDDMMGVLRQQAAERQRIQRDGVGVPAHRRQ
jgi:hypothetical protein